MDTSCDVFFVEQKVIHEEELVALNTRQKLAVPLTEKMVLSSDSRRFRFGLPTSQHKLGLPIGKVWQPFNAETLLFFFVVFLKGLFFPNGTCIENCHEFRLVIAA